MTDMEKTLADALSKLIQATKHLQPCPGTMDIAVKALEQFKQVTAAK